MKATLTRTLMMTGLIAAATPVQAATETDIAGWLKQVAPYVLTVDPAQPAQIEGKKIYFTPNGFNGFVKTLERQGALQTPRQLEALCVAGARMAEGGTWIVDAQIVYKNPQTLIQAIEPAGDKTAAPKAKPNPYLYETAQFYIPDAATAADTKINQFIPEQGPGEGFDTCRPQSEIQFRTSAIDEQLAFYESTLATLTERIEKLRAQKAAITGGAPVAAAPAPAQAQQIAPIQPQHIAPAAAPQAIPPHAPAQPQSPSQGMQLAPAASQAPVPLHPQAPSLPQTIDVNAAENILRAPAGAVRIAPQPPAAPYAPPAQSAGQ